MLVRVEDAAENAADREDDGAEQQDAHHVDGVVGGSRAEARRDHVADQPGREQENGSADHEREHKDSRDQIARQLPGGIQIPLRQEAAEDGNEGMCQGAAGDQDDDEFRDAIGGDIGVQFAADAKSPRDDQSLREADQLGGGEGDHDGERGAGDAAIALQAGGARLVFCCHSVS